MAAFKFFLVGTNEAPVLEVEADTLAQLSEIAARSRFIEGRMVEVDGEGVSCGALIPVSRIQLIAETES